MGATLALCGRCHQIGGFQGISTCELRALGSEMSIIELDQGLNRVLRVVQVFLYLRASHLLSHTFKRTYKLDQSLKSSSRIQVESNSRVGVADDRVAVVVQLVIKTTTTADMSFEKSLE